MSQNIYFKNNKKKCLVSTKKTTIGNKVYQSQKFKRKNVVPFLKKCGYDNKPFGLVKKTKLNGDKIKNIKNIRNNNKIFNSLKNPVSILPVLTDNRNKNNSPKEKFNIDKIQLFDHNSNSCWISHLLVCLLIDIHPSLEKCIFKQKIKYNGICSKSFTEKIRTILSDIYHNFFYNTSKHDTNDLRLHLKTCSEMGRDFRSHIGIGDPTEFLQKLNVLFNFPLAILNKDIIIYYNNDINEPNKCLRTRLDEEISSIISLNANDFNVGDINLHLNNITETTNLFNDLNMRDFDVDPTKKIQVDKFKKTVKKCTEKLERSDTILDTFENSFFEHVIKNVNIYGIKNEDCGDKKFIFKTKQTIYNITNPNTPLIITINRKLNTSVQVINDKKINPSEIINLKSDKGDDITYILKSLVVPNDYGSSHYTCYFNKGDSWWYYDDLVYRSNGTVKKISSYQELISSKSKYHFIKKGKKLIRKIDVAVILIYYPL